MVVNWRGLDKHDGKHTGSRKNLQAKIRGMYEQTIMHRKYTRSQRHEKEK